MKTSIERACDALGSQRNLARLRGVAPATVNQWVSGIRPVPVEHCPGIESDSGIPVEELRPDIPWHRVPDPDWPNPAGRPTIDYASRNLEAA